MWKVINTFTSNHHRILFKWRCVETFSTTFEVTSGAVINPTKEISGFKVRYAKVSPSESRHGSKKLGQRFLLVHHNSDTNNLRGRNVVILSNTSLTCSQVRVIRWCRMPPHWHGKQKWRRSYIVTTMARLIIFSSSSRGVLYPSCLLPIENILPIFSAFSSKLRPRKPNSILRARVFWLPSCQWASVFNLLIVVSTSRLRDAGQSQGPLILYKIDARF